VGWVLQKGSRTKGGVLTSGGKAKDQGLKRVVKGKGLRLGGKGNQQYATTKTLESP